CSRLTSLDLSNFDTDNVTNMSWMFSGCFALTSLNLSNFNTAKVQDMSYMFVGCSRLTSLNLSNFNTAKVQDMSNMFHGCSNLTSLNLLSFNTTNVTNMSGMFYDCSDLTSLDLSGFNTEKVTSMSQMFYCCSRLTSLNLPSFKTENVTSMSAMFNNCSGLTSLDLSNFNTAKVTDMVCMFENCSVLTSLNLSSFNTENVTNMYGMFYDCSRLTSLDLSNFNTAKVQDMRYMFSGCSVLTSLNLSNFNTANVTDMRSMFEGCSGLTSLDLSNFNTAKVTDMRYMFKSSSGLVTIYASDLFTTESVTSSSYMFSGCTSLVGAISYDPDNKNDATYANYTTGYFTLKGNVCTEHDFTGETLFNNDKKIYYKVCQKKGCRQIKYFADAAGTVEAIPNEDETAFSVATYELLDATTYDNKAVFTVADFTYRRSFGGAEWTTWYVPFDLTLTSELCDKYAFSRINNVHQYDLDNDGKAEKTVVESFRQQPGATLKANYPYLVKQLSSDYCDMVLQLSDITPAPAVTNSIDCQSVDFTYTFTGTYNEMGESGATLYDPYTLWTNGTWQHFYSLEPMRHYLTITPRHSASPAASISSIVLSVIGEENVTGIVNVYGDERKATETYDLSGRRLPAGSQQKGLVIRNGKVVYNK
ncbi:MAG: BspA family leucine-rich repeat surface protein, partial [Alloprevotella sp.]|nr:BspA family leucine-rich repeat surface protein [Alloprevotella sp.]